MIDWVTIKNTMGKQRYICLPIVYSH